MGKHVNLFYYALQIPSLKAHCVMESIESVKSHNGLLSLLLFLFLSREKLLNFNQFN